ncbi:putative histidine kinase [Dioscorea sansibarensis]
MLLGEVFGVHNACCRLKNQEAYVKLCIIINNAMTGLGTDKTDFDFVNRDGEHVQCLLSVSKKIDSEEAVSGLFFFLHISSQELQQVIHVRQHSEKSAMTRLKALAYIRHEIRTPLSGVVYAQKTLEATDLNEEQRMILKAGANCHLQLSRVLSDLKVESIMDCCSELEVGEFVQRDVVIAAVSQVMITSSSRGIRIIDSLPDVFLTESLYGDNLRLQQIIADFLIVSVKYSPSGGQVEITANVNKDRLGEHIHLVRLELSTWLNLPLNTIAHSGGVPEELLSHMFGNHGELPISEEGISLVVCRKLVKLMNGDIHYIRKEGKSTFVISLELASVTTKTKALALRISE